MRISQRKRKIMKLALFIAALSSIPYLLMSSVMDDYDVHQKQLLEPFWPRSTFDKARWSNYKQFRPVNQSYPYRALPGVYVSSSQGRTSTGMRAQPLRSGPQTFVRHVHGSADTVNVGRNSIDKSASLTGEGTHAREFSTDRRVVDGITTQLSANNVDGGNSIHASLNHINVSAISPREVTTTKVGNAETIHVGAKTIDVKADFIKDGLTSNKAINNRTMGSLTIQKTPKHIGGERMSQYCNSPFQKVVGHEGTALKGLTLQMVHVFIRHGDRASIHRINGFRSRALDCKFGTWYGGNDKKTQLFAHTMRQFAGTQPSKSYFRNWALLPDRQDCDASELTIRGVLQHINLGQFMHDVYINGSKLFNTGDDVSKHVIAFSTGTSRTYQSAIALLYGILPVFNLTNLQIDFASNAYFCTERFSLQKTCVCKHASDLLSKSRRLGSVWNSNSERYAVIKDIISDTFQLSLKKLPWMTGIMDAFAPSICHSLSVPCSSSKPVRCVNSSTIAAMWSELVRSQREVLEDPDKNHLKFASIMMYPILAEITSRMVSMAEGKHVPRFILYSGHDLTITPLLHVLGLHDGMWPPYASRVVIELYRSDLQQGTSEYFVRVLYNGQDLTREVSFCKATGHHGLCNLRDFAKFVYTEMLQRFGFYNFLSACSRLHFNKR